MSVRCPRCPAEAENLIALSAHVRETHGARRTAGAAFGATAPATAAQTGTELRSEMANGREGSVARAVGAGYEDTGELEACETCGRLERLRPVARSTWSLDPHRRTAMVCAACAGDPAAKPSPSPTP
jgi:hypothetical protein